MGIRTFLEVGEEFDADALVLLVFLYLRGGCRFCRKYDAILGYSNVAQFAKHGEASLRRRVTAAQQIEIPCWAMRCVGPHLEEHRSLQDKVIAVARLAEAVEEALQCVASENQAEVLAITGGDVEEFLANRGRDIPGDARVQVRASI